MKKIVLMLTVAFVLMLAPKIVLAQDATLVEPTAETEPSPGGGATAVAAWVHPTDPTQSLIIGTDDNFGITTYDLDGIEVQRLEVGSVSNIDVRYSFPYSDELISLIAVGVKDEQEIILFTVDPESRQLEQLGTVETSAPHTGLCLYFSHVTGNYYLFNTSDDGSVEQFVLGDDGNGGIQTSLARSFNVGSETEGCVADDEEGNLFLSEVDVALWRYDAEPEPSFPRRVIDSVGLGNITKEIKGLALYPAADGEGYLLADDAASNGFLVYERAGDQAFVDAFTLGAGAEVDEVSEPNAMDVVSLGLSDVYSSGLFITTDESNASAGGEQEDNNFKLVAWDAIAGALDLDVDPSYDERTTEVAAYMTRNGSFSVKATEETTPVEANADAADDPAVWIDPSDPSRSVVIGTDKADDGGLSVYNLDGSLQQFVTIGAVNNVDVRYNFPLDGEPTAIVAATNRTTNTLVIYRMNPETRELEDVAAREIVSNVPEVYGFCLYHSPVSGKYYAFINSTDNGSVEQWELFDNGSGKIDAELVREFVVGTQTEGCVADDELGSFYIGEEDVAIWKYNAEPDGGEERVAVDYTEEGDEPGNLIADVEGISLYYASDGAGYLIVSSQGSSEFAVYQREGDNEYVGKFVVSESAAVDGVTGSDGLDVTNFALGDLFPSGLFITQDDTNLNPSGNQNFKLVPWENIANAMQLTIDTDFDPRTIGADK